MRHISDNFYFEESSGFTYEKKSFNEVFYFSPLNFCILEQLETTDKTDYDTTGKTKAIQEHLRCVQLCRQPQPGIGTGKLRSQLGIRAGTPGRVKVFYNKCSSGVSSFHRNVRTQDYRRDSVYHILRASSASNVYGIRSQAGAKISRIKKEKINGQVNGKNVQQSLRGFYNHRGQLC